MGKSGKLFKSLVAGVRSFKSPSKERPVKEDKEYVKKKSKDKCFGSLGKSSSRNREMVASRTASPEAIEIKCVQVESEKLKDVLPVPVAEPYRAEPHSENKAPPTSQEGEINGSGFIQLSPPGSKVHTAVSDREEWAASKIQAAFRCYLAQRAFRALRALVRLQALARGRLVRRQAAASLRCMNALIRIQALARGRRVRNSELGQLVHKHSQQTKQSRKKPAEGWVNSTATAQQLQAKAQVKQDAVTKRQRALVYTFSEQLNRRTQKQSSSSGPEIDKSHWVWEWLERWTATTPKGGSATTSVEDYIPSNRNMEKAKVNTKGGKHPESARKERRKWGEHATSISPLPQRDIISEEYEEPSMEVNREEEMKLCQDLERLGTPIATVARGFSSVMSSVQKPTSLSPTLATPPLSPFKECNALVARESGLHEVESSASDMSSVTQVTPNNAIEEDLATQTMASISTGLGCNHVPRADTTSSSDANIAMLCLPAASQVLSSHSILSTSNGHSVCGATGIFHMGPDSPQELISNSLSGFPFAPEEVRLSSESLMSSHASSEPNMQGSSVTHALSTPELAGEVFSNGFHDQPQEIIQDREPNHSMDGDKERHVIKETEYCMNGDATGESGEHDSVVTESVDLKNDDSNEGDILSEMNGGCDASVVSVDVQTTEVSSKNMSASGSKHDQTESASPSLPSYMATTKSSKAKIRALNSPKHKPDPTKQKQESPKPKLESPKTKVDSPTTQKVDSASKRRHSLSALDGKVSPGNSKPAFHVRAGSKGNFSSLKDLSSDNFSVSNGDSRRHGK